VPGLFYFSFRIKLHMGFVQTSNLPFPVSFTAIGLPQ